MEVVEEGLHFAGGMDVAGALGGVEALCQACDRFVRATELGEGLGRHLVGGNVVGVVVNEGGELGERDVGVALGGVLHGQAVAGEGVGRVGLQDFGEGGDLVHELMVASESV